MILSNRFEYLHISVDIPSIITQKKNKNKYNILGEHASIPFLYIER